MYVALVIVLNPNCPNSDATEEAPNFNIVDKLLRNLLTKEGLFPMKKKIIFSNSHPTKFVHDKSGMSPCSPSLAALQKIEEHHG